MVFEHIRFVHAELDCDGGELHFGVARVSHDKNLAFGLVFDII